MARNIIKHLRAPSNVDRDHSRSAVGSPPHDCRYRLYEDITSPPTRIEYADAVRGSSRSPPPTPGNPERHWPEVYRGYPPSAVETYAGNGHTPSQHHSTRNVRGYDDTYSGCYNCGERNHKRANCRYTEKLKCGTCGKWGHKSRHCPHSP